jgi:phospholipid/cholesterol/gamma-HCH transport system substrate-binding protein
MENRAHAFMAGLFAIALLAGLVGAVLWLSHKGREPGLPYVLVSKTSVGGLNPQAAVRYLGVEVGRVQNIQFDPSDRRTILIDVTIHPDVPITDKTFARLGAQGVTGMAFVELDEEKGGGKARSTDWLSPARIELRPSFLQEFGDSGQLLLVRVNDIAQRLNVLLKDENQTRLSNTLVSIERMTERLVTVQEKLIPSLDRLPQITRETEALLGETRSAMRETTTLVRDLTKQLETLEQVGRGADQMGVAASDLSTQTLPALNRLLGRMSRTTELLERTLEAQAHDPQSLIFGQARVEPGPGEPGYSPRRSR